MSETVINNLNNPHKKIGNLDKKGKTLRSELSYVARQLEIQIEHERITLVKLGLSHFLTKSTLQSTKTRPLVFPTNQSSLPRRKLVVYGILIKMLLLLP